VAAAINFYVPNNSILIPVPGSGLGFYGDSFGASVQVGSYQNRTFITDGNGTIQGPEGNNIKYVNSQSGIVASAGSGINILTIPNYQSTLQARFTYDSAVQVQNAEFRVYDRSNINSGATGVTTKAAEVIHTSLLQSVVGSGDNTWYTPAGSAITVPLAQSPGASGHYAGNGAVSTRADNTHDWYLLVSASPDSIGSKTLYAGYCSLEYL
jgi:hypothetical protein